MEPTWHYVMVALFAIAGAMPFCRAVGNKTSRRRMAAWLLILFGAVTLIVATPEIRQDLFFIAAGLMFLMAGFLELLFGPKRGTNIRQHS